MTATMPTSTDPVEQDFLDLVLTDPDLLRAEFEQIIASAWPDPPPPHRPQPPVGPANPSGPGNPQTRPGPGPALPPRWSWPTAWGRQRAPPAAPPWGLRWDKTPARDIATERAGGDIDRTDTTSPIGAFYPG